MASRSVPEGGLAPVLTVLSLLASCGVLVGGFYVAHTYYEESQGGVPEVGVWGDDAQDRLLVVSGDEGADWQGLELKTGRPARASLDGEADLAKGTLSPGSKFVALSGAPQAVIGGDALSICAVAQAGPMQVTLRDAASKAVLFDQSLDVKQCGHGAGGVDASIGPETAGSGTDADGKAKGGKERA